MAKESKKGTGDKGQQLTQATTQARPLTPFEEMDRLMESFFPRRWMHPFHWDLPSPAELGVPFEGRMPRVDIIDRDSEILVRAEVPGIEKEDLDVSVTGNTVTIKGSSRHEEREEKGDYHRCEIRRGNFSRTVTLPAAVDSDKARASFKDGILELTLPKLEKSRRKSVAID